MPKEQILTTDVIPVQFREGTLGATSEQVLAGLKKAKKCDVDAIVCIGEAAIKYKEQIKDYLSEVS